MRADPGMAERMRSITASLTPDQIDAMVGSGHIVLLRVL